MALIITASCIVLGYPVAWLLANLPMRTSSILMILVLLPFWTSLLVRTSAWKVLLQQQGVINEILVWLGFVNDADRLILMNNATGTVIAMRSEEHTSELQSHHDLVCRLLLEKKKRRKNKGRY